MKRTLKVKDIERLENTSFAAVGALAATPGGAQVHVACAAGTLGGVDPIGCGSVSCVTGGSCTAICSIGVSQPTTIEIHCHQNTLDNVDPIGCGSVSCIPGPSCTAICSIGVSQPTVAICANVSGLTEPPPCTGICSIGVSEIK